VLLFDADEAAQPVVGPRTGQNKQQQERRRWHSLSDFVMRCRKSMPQVRKHLAVAALIILETVKEK
jgi:hypothetical protein